MSGALAAGYPGRLIETKPLVGVVLGLALGALPLAPRLAGWVLGLFLLCGVARVLMNRPTSRLPSLPVKVILFGLGIGGVGLTYGSMLGIEPSLSILLVLVALKLIETNGERDFHVLGLLGYFLTLCDLFFSQDLIVWLYVAVVGVLVTASLVRFHRGPGAGGYRRSTMLAVTLFAQALPVVVVLFFFFPRVYGGFRFQFSQSLLGNSGMSDRLSPGSVASLALSDQTAFRVDFPDGNVPTTAAMYWRGVVLWHGEGLSWTVGPALSPQPRMSHLGGQAVRQRISLLPHGARWMFALDRPASDVKGAFYQPGGYLQSRRMITNQFRYEVISRPENRETVLPPDQLTEATRIPSVVAPRVQALVDKWKADYPNPVDLVEAALNHFRREHFSYTLNPGTYQDSNAVESFLFERREGFCEHYAAAFATLMRLAGIPSRVVIGYHGGEFNSLGSYVIVRQADAHAWCEVWLKNEGWQRVDPTDMIAPERISAGLASYLHTHETRNSANASQLSATATGWREVQRELQREVRLVWDSINYQWDLRVLNFDEETQRNFLFSLGLGSSSWTEIMIWVGVGISVMLAVLALWLRRPRNGSRDEIGQAYDRFCRVLAKAGLQKEPWEGPQHFGERAAARFVAQAEAIREVIRLYIQSRYGATGPTPKTLTQAVRKLPRLEATSGT